MARDVLTLELNAVHTSVQTLGDAVDRALAEAMNALTHGDLQEAAAVIAGDAEVDRMRKELEALCLYIIASQQPLATDLRTVFAALDIAANLERMGDHCEGLAHLAERMADMPISPPPVTLLQMAATARAMLHDALLAFSRTDVMLAGAVIARDDIVDRLNKEVTRDLFGDMRRQPDLALRDTYLLWVAHNLERLADRATNIAERVVFVVTGELHPPAMSHIALSA